MYQQQHKKDEKGRNLHEFLLSICRLICEANYYCIKQVWLDDVFIHGDLNCCWITKKKKRVTKSTFKNFFFCGLRLYKKKIGKRTTFCFCFFFFFFSLAEKKDECYMQHSSWPTSVSYIHFHASFIYLLSLS